MGHQIERDTCNRNRLGGPIYGRAYTRGALKGNKGYQIERDTYNHWRAYIRGRLTA